MEVLDLVPNLYVTAPGGGAGGVSQDSSPLWNCPSGAGGGASNYMVDLILVVQEMGPDSVAGNGPDMEMGWD